MTTKAAQRFTLPDTSLSPIFDGWQAGHFDLPPVVTDAAAAYLALVPAAFSARQERDRLYPGHERTLGSREAFERAEDSAERAAAARDLALRNLEGMISGIGDELVVDYLRPAFAAALEAVREALPALEGVDLTDTASVAAGGPDAGPAFLAVVDARRRLDAITRARETVFDRIRLGSAWRDSSREARLDGYLADTSTWPLPGVRTISKAGRITVGPVHPLERARWLADPANGAWCPTAGEWEAEFGRWMADPARNGRVTGPVAMVRG